MAITAFDDLDALTSAAVDQAFGRPAILHPMTSASQYAASAPDVTRQIVEVVGILSIGPDAERLAGQQKQGATAGPTMLAGQVTVFWISAATVAALPWAVKRGDHVSFPDDPSRRYRIVTARPTDMRDLELTLTEE